MAKDIQNVQGIQSDADYPTGYKPVDTQTLIGTNILQDIIILFQKLLDNASITPNGNYDNEVNGYQLLEALKNNTLPVKSQIDTLSDGSGHSAYIYATVSELSDDKLVTMYAAVDVGYTQTLSTSIIPSGLQPSGDCIQQTANDNFFQVRANGDINIDNSNIVSKRIFSVTYLINI